MDDIIIAYFVIDGKSVFMDDIIIGGVLQDGCGINQTEAKAKCLINQSFAKNYQAGPL